MTAMQIVWLVIGIVGLTLAILLIVFSLVARMGRRRTAETESRYPNALLVVPGANFFGQESAGVGQVRGNGTLVLTSNVLIFEMWVPQRTVKIPLDRITSVDTVKSFLAKTRGVPLLRVSFQQENGLPDAAAWQVRDVEGVMAAIQEQIVR
jgi:hypothetical protein